MAAARLPGSDCRRPDGPRASHSPHRRPAVRTHTGAKLPAVSKGGRAMRLWVKILMVAAMTIAILVPLTLVRGVIDERQARRAEAVTSIAASYGGRQVVSGPVLVVPYTETVREQSADAAGIMRTTERRRTRHWTFFPETLVVDG